MKGFWKVLLTLLLLGGTAAAGAAAYERYVAGPAREREARRANAAQVLADAARDAAVDAQRTTLRILARDSARADSMALANERIAALEVDSITLVERLSRAVTPQETVLVVINALDSTRQALAVCKGNIALCERRIQDVRDSALAAQEAATALLVEANDSLVASNDGLLLALHPPLTFPRLVLKVGGYARDAAAVWGAIDVVRRVVGDGDDGSSRSEWPQCQVVSPLTLRVVF